MKKQKKEKNAMKKWTFLLMAGVVGASVCVSATGCRRGEDSEAIDSSKTQLYISNFDAGIGRAWVERLGEEFEKDFEDYSFEDGKKGVQVLYNHNTKNKDSAFLDALEQDEDTIYFTEQIDYSYYYHKFYDLTSIMKEGAITGVDDNGNFTRESESIVSKMDPTLLSFLNKGTAGNEKYHALPYYLGLKNVNYDVDLWSENKYFFSEGGCPSEIVAKALKENGDVDAAVASYYTELQKLQAGQASDYWFFVDRDGKAEIDGESMDFGLSAGPDGKYDTFDDGLPATYEEFYLLMDKMSAEVTPFIWPGSNPGYADMLTTSLWQNNEGAENLKTYYSLNGTVSNLVKLDQNGEIVKDSKGKPVIDAPVTFTGGKDNGYEIQRSVEKYYALQFAQKIAQTDDWTNVACYDGTTQSSAQSKYLTQGYTDKGQGIKKTAMLIDGCWWQQEATATFDIMAKTDKKYAKENREFAMMALPNSTIERMVTRKTNNEKLVTVSTNDSFAFINGGLKEGDPLLAVAKTFMSYIHSDKSLNIFTEVTNIFRPFDYEITDETESKMSLYGKNLMEYRDNLQIVYPYSTNSFMNGNQAVFKNGYDGWNWHSYTNLMGEETQPVDALHNERDKGATADDYFEGLYNYCKTTAWQKLDMDA